MDKVLQTVLMEHTCPNTIKQVLWGLSNLVIEPEFSVVFFNNRKLAQRVL